MQDRAATDEDVAGVSADAAELIAFIRSGAERKRERADVEHLHSTDFEHRYELLHPLGEGAMGTVWRAKDRKLGRTVAVKLLKPELQANPIVVERAIAEARVASEARHPHIVEIYDVGTTADGAIFTVMEWLDARPLTTLVVAGHGLPWPRCRRILGQIGRAMEHAHACGIIHRDLKPDNILVAAREGEDDFCKVIDFGLSKQFGMDKRLTQTGQLLGTPYYMSPEQVLGRAADKRSDIYALGVIAYELLTGSRPFEGDGVYQVFSAHVEGEIPAIPAALDTADRRVDAMIRRALAKDQDDRFSSMKEFVAAVEAVPETLRGGAVTTNRIRARVLVAALAVVVLGSGWFAAWSMRSQPVDPPTADPIPRLEAKGASEADAALPTETTPLRVSDPVETPKVNGGEVVAPAVPQPASSVPQTSEPSSARERRGRRDRSPTKPPSEAAPPAATTAPTVPEPRSKSDSLFEQIEKLDKDRPSPKKPELLDE